MKNIFQINQNIKFYFKILTLLFIISGTLGFITAQQFPGEATIAMEQAAKEISFIKDLNPSEVFLLIAVNNSVKTLLVMIMGILWGIIPVLFILINGYAVGVIASIVIFNNGLIYIILGTFPHGIFEIPAVLLAASYGVWLGEMFSKKLKKRSIKLGTHTKNALSKFTKIIFPVLIVAAFIETFITTWILDTFIS